jgi:hypothetical protein
VSEMKRKWSEGGGKKIMSLYTVATFFKIVVEIITIHRYYKHKLSVRM